jgi:hypothetical protein
MMQHDDNPALPPPHVLEALRAPRRPRLDDPGAREILRRWRRLGQPIGFAELRELGDFLMPEPQVSVDRIREIMAAVEAVGFAIHDDDLPSHRQFPMPERVALRRIAANVWKDRAKLVMDQANACEDDDPQKRRHLETARELRDRANGKTTWFGRVMI